MKLSMILMGLLSLAPAFAAEQDPCQKFMACGTYEGEGTAYDSQGVKEWDFLENWQISKVNENTLRVQQAMFEKTEQREEIYSADIEITFNDEGAYEIRQPDGSLFATGVCRQMACTFSFMPRKVSSEGKDYIVLNVNTFRFTEGKLQRLLMVTSEQGMPRIQNAELTKK